MKVALLVVPEKTLPPHLPSGSISQLGDGPVQQSDGSSAIIVVGDPSHGIVDPVVMHIKQTVAFLLGRWVVDGLAVVGLLDLLPDIHHVELVHHPLQGRPEGAQTIVILANVVENLVHSLHGCGEEILSQRVFWSVGDDFLVGMAVHVHSRDAVLLSGPRVEEL